MRTRSVGKIQRVSKMSNDVVLSALNSQLLIPDGGLAVTNIKILKYDDMSVAYVIDEYTKFGEQGPPGPPGVTGEVGPRGPRGNPGRPYVIGCSGGTGPATDCCTKIERWISTYLINTPPAIQWCPPTSECDAIYFSWAYPSQISVGFAPGWLPYIQSFTAMLYTTDTTKNRTTQTMLVNANQNEFINQHDNTTPYATGIIFYKQAGTNSFGAAQFPNEPVSRYAYKCYNIQLQNVNMIQIWYSNLSTQPPAKIMIPFDPWICPPPVFSKPLTKCPVPKPCGT